MLKYGWGSLHSKFTISIIFSCNGLLINVYAIVLRAADVPNGPPCLSHCSPAALFMENAKREALKLVPEDAIYVLDLMACFTASPLSYQEISDDLFEVFFKTLWFLSPKNWQNGKTLFFKWKIQFAAVIRNFSTNILIFCPKSFAICLENELSWKSEQHFIEKI